MFIRLLHVSFQLRRQLEQLVGIGSQSSLALQFSFFAISCIIC
jgi:hypothetical protein